MKYFRLFENYPDTNIVWYANSIAVFPCVKCGKEIMVDSGDESICKCGTKYFMATTVYYRNRDEDD